MVQEILKMFFARRVHAPRHYHDCRRICLAILTLHHDYFECNLSNLLGCKSARIDGKAEGKLILFAIFYITRQTLSDFPFFELRS